MQMVGEDHVRIDLERVTRADLLDGIPQEHDRRRFSKQGTPMLGDEREEIRSAGGIDASVSHRAFSYIP
jgi:hypothetical protein